jgi:hypothetical protein
VSTIKPGDIGDAIAKTLEIYHDQVVTGIDAAGEEAMKKLVKKTKATAPVGVRGSFKKSITSTRQEGPRGDRFVWHVKAPDHRLTHLLVHGHAKVNGGRTRSDPFLHRALDEVLPDYEKAVEEAVKND